MSALPRLQRMVEEYVAVAFPDSSEIDRMSEREISENGDRMRSLALHITDLIIEAGVHRGEAVR